MEHRLNDLKQMLVEEGMDGALISSRPNTFYFTGFSGTTSKCLVTKDKAYILVDFRYIAQAREQAFPGIEVIRCDKDILEGLPALCIRHGVQKLGVEGNDLTFGGYKSLQKNLKSVTAYTDIQKKINSMRMIKDKEEQDKIQKAADIADQALNETLELIKPGVKEYEIALELEYKMKKLGAKGVSFETIIASGPRSALPHGVASMREFENGDSIVIDFGANYQGYCSDMTRTIFLGTPPQKLKEIYHIVLEAQLAALQKAAVNMTGLELDQVSRKIISEAGYGEYFGHGLGHGVGVEIHEMPTISQKGEEKLKQGMVFTIEPGIYIEGLGGVRIEDMVYVTENGVNRFTKSSKELVIL